MSTPLVILATVFDRLGHYEPAATISAFAAAKPWARTANPEINTTVAHLRDVLGTTTYQPLADAGENMTNAEMAAYALDQIERARARVPK
jgi:hypothetical protein